MVPSGAIAMPRVLFSFAALAGPPSPEKPPTLEPMGEVIVPFVSIILTLAPPASQTYRLPAASKAMALGGLRGGALGGGGPAARPAPPSPVVACAPVPATAETVV